MANLVLGSDHAGFPLKQEIRDHLAGQGHEVTDLGCHDTTSVDYPDLAQAVAEQVARESGHDNPPLGILVCGTGIGMSIAANKVAGVRAALCHSEFEARMSRAHNNANVLCLGARVIGRDLAMGLVDAFLASAFEGGRHARRVAKIESGS